MSAEANYIALAVVAVVLVGGAIWLKIESKKYRNRHNANKPTGGKLRGRHPHLAQ